MDNVRGIKRNPETVLNSLSEHSGNTGYRFERLYRNFFNAEFLYVAYQNIYAKPGNMTEGADGITIDEMSLNRIDLLMDALKKETYQPNPSRRTYILKKSGKKRPLGIPSIDDKLVQEVTRMILEAIFEKQFSNRSHGFRPQRSCHTALTQVQRSFNGTKWFIEGDIKGFFDNIDHDVLIRILNERINDERFIRLIRKFLKAGYLEDWTFHNTYSGTPQGGIISPILANIYLDKLDKFMEEYIHKFDKGEKRERQTSWEKLPWKKKCLIKKLHAEEDKTNRKDLIKMIKALEKVQFSTPIDNEMDGNYKRLKYVRYADDFLIGVIGSKEEGKKIKEDIKMFLCEKLCLELSEDKTLITHGNAAAKFLGYNVYVRRSYQAKRNKLGRLTRRYNKKIVLELAMSTIKEKLLQYNVLKLKHHNGKEVWRPQARAMLRNNDDLEILQRFNSEIRGFYNYYSIANNCGLLNSFYYIMRFGMYKTFAFKYQITVRQILLKYNRNNVFTVEYMNKKGEQKSATLFNEGFKRKMLPTKYNPDILPNAYYTNATTSLIDRLQARCCEVCGETDDLEMHHVRKLKDLNSKSKRTGSN